MNLIYLHTHDSGRFIQPYGYGIPTPNLMKFAERGTLFRRAYCAAPTCSPSRASMLTGMNPHTCGVTGLVHRGFQLKDPTHHLAGYLKRAGFETALCGVQHETSGDPEELGYTQVYTGHLSGNHDFETIDETSTEAAVAFLKQKKTAPFFLSLGFMDTHRDFPEVDHPTNPDYVSVPPGLPDCRETRKDFAKYIDSVGIVDRCCGKIFDTLDELGLWDDTIVFFTTDHGIAFPKMKCSLYDTGIGVSLIFHFPQNPQKGKVVDAMVSHLDVFPTICELLGLLQPAWLEGTSMMPLLNGTADKIRDCIFSEVTYHAAYEPMRCIRTERYKLIRRFDDYPYPVFCNTDEGESKSYLLRHDWKELQPEPWMLFDLIQDPAERNNLADCIDYRHILDELQEQLTAWMKETSDPLLLGPVPKPLHSRINQKTCLRCTDQIYENGSQNPHNEL